MPARQPALQWGSTSKAAPVLPPPMPKPLPDVSRLFDDEDRHGDRPSFGRTLRAEMHAPGASVSRPRSGARRSATPQPSNASYSQRAISRLDNSVARSAARASQPPRVYVEEAPAMVSTACQTESATPASPFTMQFTPQPRNLRPGKPTFSFGEEALAPGSTLGGETPAAGSRRGSRLVASTVNSGGVTPVESRSGITPRSTKAADGLRRTSVASAGSADNTEFMERRRKSLMRLMRMNTDEISALGAIEDTIAKVGDEDYDLAVEIPHSPSGAAGENPADSPHRALLPSASILSDATSYTENGLPARREPGS